MHQSVELPPLQHQINQQSSPLFQSSHSRELLPSVLAHSPPGRSSTLPPLQRKESIKRDKPARPRKSSITQNSRRPKHERTKSKDQARRLSIEGRKAFSAEPPGAVAAAMGKRWEDLIEAATSATEADSDRDLTPVCASLVAIAVSLTDICRSPNLHRQSNAPPCLRTPFRRTKITRLHLSRTRSHRHRHTVLLDQHHLLPSMPRWTLQTPHNLRWPADRTFTFPPLVSRTVQIQLLQLCTPTIIRYRYIARDVGGLVFCAKAMRAQDASQVSAATVSTD